ncbi:sulfurtransferase [Elongatibacter sediminis]|uniref:Sulfurtransferase n=1 Tax=Elongatibacter sediminis TaxID=3119006 RepID=A0AAW9RMW3_9GAMM
MFADLLVDAATLERGLGQGRLLAVDCRFDLSDPNRGRAVYLEGHVPGARYAHLDDDLSSPVTPASGRHPLPDTGRFSAFLGRIGWHPETRLVAYDERNNAMASRLWWLMRYFGLPAALLDGGLEAWQRAGFPLQPGEPDYAPTDPPELSPAGAMTVSAAQVLDAVPRRELTLLDARAPERYTGEVEPLDSRGGHIPGAINRPLGLNLEADGRFKAADRLGEEFRELLGDADPRAVVNYCGSGVTACHNQFAMELAGIEGARVYPGSWSEWTRDPARPVETGRD